MYHENRDSFGMRYKLKQLSRTAKLIRDPEIQVRSHKFLHFSADVQPWIPARWLELWSKSGV